MSSRRQFLYRSAGFTALAAQAYSTPIIAGTKTEFGDSELIVLSDGNLSLPSGLILPDAIDQAEKEAFLSEIVWFYLMLVLAVILCLALESYSVIWSRLK